GRPWRYTPASPTWAMRSFPRAARGQGAMRARAATGNMDAMAVHPSRIPTQSPFETLKVGDVMHAGVVSCPPDASLHAVASLMSLHGIHSVFVFDDDLGEAGAFVGIVSDLDLVAAAWIGLETRTAGQSAVTPIVTVTTENALEHAAELMVEKSL